jgi:fatty-acyl-CoA synthase
VRIVDTKEEITVLTVREMVRRNRYRCPDAEAVVDEARRLTHAEFTDRCWALAAGLIERGVRVGDTVGIMAGNGVFSAETYAGAGVAGAVAVPYNWRSATPEMVHQINDSGARIVLAEETWRSALEEARQELDRELLIVYEGPEYDSLLRFGGEPDVALGPEDGAVIIYTGGTTGASKGVLLSHRNVFSNCLNEIYDTEMVRADRTLLTTPMYHAAALLHWFLPHLLLGATSVFVRAFDEERVVAAMERERITNLFLIPNMLRRILTSGALISHDVRAMRRLYVGGASFKLPDKLEARAQLPGVDFYYQYGLTEGGPIVTRLRPEDMFREDLDGSIGQEFLLTEVSIRDPDGHEVPLGTPGEICVKSPGVMKGYFNRPDATKDVFRDGWLRTGDVAARVEGGYFYFHDRLKDMIKTGGANVYSAEVEQVLYGHAAILEAAVIGVPSSEWDEEVRAVVALRPDAVATEDELRTYCRRFLAGYKVPKRIAIVDPADLPVNPSGKILKRKLRSQDLWAPAV